MSGHEASTSRAFAQSANGHHAVDRTTATAWIASVFTHGALFAIMVAVPWITRTVLLAPALPPPNTTVVVDHDDVKFSVVPPQSPFAPSAAPIDVPVHIAPQAQGALDNLRNAALADAAPASSPLSVIGIGVGGSETSDFGLPSASGLSGPSFFGLGRQARGARRIVYVVDRSGSMTDLFAGLRQELKRSIDGLRKSQKFHVIFYNSGDPLELPAKRLVSAVRSAKDEAFAFLETVRPEGMTEPANALRRAFDLNPDLIYFLSDGDIPEGERLKDRLKEWNVTRRVRIFTIAFVNRDGSILLQDIAREHNGQFKYVSEDDLP